MQVPEENTVTATTIICRTCRRPLDTLVSEDGAGYIHTEYDVQRGDGRDHQADPIVAADGQTRWRCDFCHIDTPAPWLFPARALTWQGQLFDEGWTADRDCAQLIIARDWRSLAHRAFAGYRAAMGEPISGPERILLFDLWRTLDEHLVGEPIAPEAS